MCFRWERARERSQLGCGMNHFLITGLFPLVWCLACGPASPPTPALHQQQAGSQHMRIGSDKAFTQDTHTSVRVGEC